MSRMPIVLMDDAALRQRRDELVAARRRIDVEVERITTALMARRPKPARETKHGTTRTYKAGCRCPLCGAANSAERARYRARRKEREMAVVTKYPRVGRPKVELAPGPNGLVYAMCRHCDWQAGPSVKTYVAERAIDHRADHRAGRIEVR